MPSLFHRNPATHGPGSIGCTRTLLKLQEYLDGDLDEATADKIFAHIAACERCGLRAEAYTAIKTSLSRRRAEDDAEVEPMVDRLREFAGSLMTPPAG